VAGSCEHDDEPSCSGATELNFLIVSAVMLLALVLVTSLLVLNHITGIGLQNLRSLGESKLKFVFAVISLYLTKNTG
jgi:hypothetical protein